MIKNTENDIKELLLELVGETIQPSLEGIPFNTPNEVRKALQFLADEIESIDPIEVFENMTVDSDNPFDGADEEEVTGLEEEE